MRQTRYRFLSSHVAPHDGRETGFREVSMADSKSRTVSFYVPKSDVLMWNTFVRYAGLRGENVNRMLMRAVRQMVSRLDHDDIRMLRLALRQVVEADAKIAEQARDFLQEVIGDEDINKILVDRSKGMVKRRMDIYKKALIWFGTWEKHKNEVGILDPKALGDRDEKSEE